MHLWLEVNGEFVVVIYACCGPSDERLVVAILQGIGGDEHLALGIGSDLEGLVVFFAARAIKMDAALKGTFEVGGWEVELAKTRPDIEGEGGGQPQAIVFPIDCFLVGDVSGVVVFKDETVIKSCTFYHHYHQAKCK